MNNDTPTNPPFPFGSMFAWGRLSDAMEHPSPYIVKSSDIIIDESAKLHQGILIKVYLRHFLHGRCGFQVIVPFCSTPAIAARLLELKFKEGLNSLNRTMSQAKQP